MKMKTWWKIRRLSSFLFPSPLFLLFSDWFLPACPCSVFISFSCGLLYSLSVLALLFFGFCEFVLWRRRRSWGTLAFSLVFLPLFLFRLPFFLSSPLCIISLLWVFASVFALSFPVWFFFLSFSLCIISLLWVFLLCFLCFFFLFFGLIFLFCSSSLLVLSSQCSSP